MKSFSGKYPTSPPLRQIISCSGASPAHENLSLSLLKNKTSRIHARPQLALLLRLLTVSYSQTIISSFRNFSVSFILHSGMTHITGENQLQEVDSTRESSKMVAKRERWSVLAGNGFIDSEKIEKLFPKLKVLAAEAHESWLEAKRKR